MPTYVYSCPRGHLEERIFSVEARKRWVRCSSCGKRASRAIGIEQRGVQITPDIPEHFNISLDTVVKSRSHLRQLQRERGCQDYERVRERPDPYSPRKDPVIFPDIKDFM